MERLSQYHTALSEHIEAAMATLQTQELRQCINEAAQELEPEDEKVRSGSGLIFRVIEINCYFDFNG